MSLTTKFIVMPFRKGARGKITAGENREARNAAAAERLALNMSDRFAGAAAYRIDIDEETGEMSNGVLLAHYGEIVNILEDA